MEITDYAEWANGLYAKWLTMDILKDDVLQQQFMVFCANMRRFRPEVTWQAMPDLFKRLKARIELAAIDQSYPEIPDAIEISGWDTAWVKALPEKPGIICTYHTGSYRLICRMLAKAGVHFALLLAKSVLAQQGPVFNEQYIHASRKGGKKRLTLIDAESPTALFAIREALRSGYQLVAYVDGNTGTKTMTKSNNLVDVPFFQSTLPVRSGLAYVAALMDVPIYPVVCTRPSHKRIHFGLLNPYYADKSLAREANARQLMHRLYGVLENAIQQHPDEWEGWLYLHGLVGRKPKKATMLHKSFWRLANRLPLRIDDSYFALDLTTWLSYPVGKAGFNLLLRKHMKRTGLA